MANDSENPEEKKNPKEQTSRVPLPPKADGDDTTRISPPGDDTTRINVPPPVGNPVKAKKDTSKIPLEGVIGSEKSSTSRIPVDDAIFKSSTIEMTNVAGDAKASTGKVAGAATGAAAAAAGAIGAAAGKAGNKAKDAAKNVASGLQGDVDPDDPIFKSTTMPIEMGDGGDTSDAPKGPSVAKLGVSGSSDGEEGIQPTAAPSADDPIFKATTMPIEMPEPGEGKPVQLKKIKKGGAGAAAAGAVVAGAAAAGAAAAAGTPKTVKLKRPNAGATASPAQPKTVKLKKPGAASGKSSSTAPTIRRPAKKSETSRVSLPEEAGGDSTKKTVRLQRKTDGKSDGKSSAKGKGRKARVSSKRRKRFHWVWTVFSCISFLIAGALCWMIVDTLTDSKDGILLQGRDVGVIPDGKWAVPSEWKEREFRSELAPATGGTTPVAAPVKPAPVDTDPADPDATPADPDAAPADPDAADPDATPADADAATSE